MVGYTGSVRDGSLDYNSPFFVSSGAIGAFIVTDDGTTIRVYHTTDIQAVGSITWSLVTNGSFSPGTGWNGKVRIMSSREEANFLVVAWKDQTGVKVSRSTAPTPSFGAPITIGSVLSPPDTDHDSDELGMWVSDEFQVILAPDGSISTEDNKYKYFPYAATTKSGSFSTVAGVPAGYRAVLGCVYSRGPGDFFVAMENPIPATPEPLTTVTFDPSGWFHYDILGAGTTTIGPTPPAAYNSVNLAGIGLGNGLLVTIPFLADYVLYGMTWLAGEGGGTLTNKSYFVRVDLFDAEDTLLKRIENTSSTTFLMALTADDIDLDVPVRSVEISISLSWTSDTGTGINNVLLDNVTFDVSLVEETVQRKLYRVALPSTWDDVTPSTPALPVTPYAMSADLDNASDISMVAQDEKGYTRLLNTTSGGGSWSTRKRNVKYTGLKRGGTTLIAWGFNCVDLSADTGLTFYRRVGNWAAAVGAVDEIRWVAGVL